MRRVGKVILASLLILSVLAGGLIFTLFFTPVKWGGPALLDLIQAKINGKISAKKISGNPFGGITYTDVVVEGPDGKVFLQSDRLEVRLSLQSIPTLHLIITEIVLHKPVFQVIEESGQWNFNGLIKTAPPPSRPAGLIDRLTDQILRQMDLSKILVEQGEIVLTREGVATRYSDLALNLNLTLNNLGKPDLKINIDRADLEITAPQGRIRFDTRLSYQTDLAKIDFLNFKLAEQTILSLQGEICRPLTDITCQATGRLGPLKGDNIHALWSRWPRQWGLAGDFNLKAGPEGMALEAQGEIGQARYEAKGEFNAKSKPAIFDLVFNLKGLTTGQIQEIQGAGLEKFQGLSPLKADLHLHGSGFPWNPHDLEGSLKIEPFRFKEIEVNSLHLTLKGNAKTQVFQGNIKGNFGAVAVVSRGRLLPLGEEAQGSSGDLSLHTEALQPSLMGLVNLPGTTLNTDFTGRFNLGPGYSLDQLYLAGDLKANGRLGEETLRDLRAGFALDGRRLMISRATIQLAALSATFRGTFTDSAVDASFIATAAKSGCLPVPTHINFGALKAYGEVRGTWKSPQMNLTAQAQNFSFQSNRVDSINLHATLAGLPPQSGKITLQGSNLRTKAVNFSQINLNAQGEAGIWDIRLVAASPPSSRLELAAAADFRSRPLGVRVGRIAWQNHSLTVKNKAPFELKFLPGFEISPVTFQVNGGLVMVQGRGRGSELSGQLEVKELDAALVKTFGVPISGKISGKATLAGSPRSPLIDGNFALTSGEINKIPISAISLKLGYRPDQVQISGLVEEGKFHSRLLVKGSLPMKLSLEPFRLEPSDQGLDLTVQGEKVNLCLVTMLSPEIQAAQSPVDISISAQGSLSQPRVSGFVRWGEGCIQLRQAGIPYGLESGEIRFQGDRVEIPGIMLRSQGTLRVSGNIIVSGVSKVEVQAQDFLVLNRGGNEAWIAGAVKVSGPMSALAATGQVSVPKARFRPTFFQQGLDPDIKLVGHKPAAKGNSSQPGLYRKMRIDVAIDSPGNVFLKDPHGEVELAIAVKAIKKPGQELALGGEIRALGGTMGTADQTFKVERAVITLPGIPDKPITVDARATRALEKDDITLVLTVNGVVTNPQINLESVPPLPPSDVLSYMVFGAPAASLSKEQYLTLGTGVLGGATQLDQILAATIPFFRGVKTKTGLLAGRPTFEVSKEITKNISISYGRSLNEARGQYENQAKIQYKINRHLRLESQVGARNPGADVYFNYDF